MDFTPAPKGVWKDVQVSSLLDRTKATAMHTLMAQGQASTVDVMVLAVATMLLSAAILVVVAPPMVTTRPTSDYERPTTAPMAVVCWSVLTATAVVGLRLLWN